MIYLVITSNKSFSYRLRLVCLLVLPFFFFVILLFFLLLRLFRLGFPLLVFRLFLVLPPTFFAFLAFFRDGELPGSGPRPVSDG